MLTKIKTADLNTRQKTLFFLIFSYNNLNNKNNKSNENA